MKNIFTYFCFVKTRKVGTSGVLRIINSLIIALSLNFLLYNFNAIDTDKTYTTY